jgi:hypothetical protein
MKPTEVSAIARLHCIILGKLSRSELIDLILACEEHDDFHASAFTGLVEKTVLQPPALVSHQ